LAAVSAHASQVSAPLRGEVATGGGFVVRQQRDDHLGEQGALHERCRLLDLAEPARQIRPAAVGQLVPRPLRAARLVLPRLGDQPVADHQYSLSE